MINITAIGDSIIDAVGRCSVTELNQWPVLLLTQRMEQTIISMTPFSPWTGGDKGPNNKIVTEDYTFYNAGIGSETTVTMLGRFEQDVLGHPTDIVIILGGVNDLAYQFGMSDIQKNLLGMYNKADEAGLDVIAATLLPWNNGSASQKEQLTVLNNWIRETAANRRYGIVDWFTILENPVGSGRISPTLTCDGVHVNVVGQQMMADTFDLTQLTHVTYDLYSYALVRPLTRSPAQNYILDVDLITTSYQGFY